MIATSGFLTALECTKFVSGRTPLGELTALPRSPIIYTGLRGPYHRGGERRGRGGERRGREGKG